MNDIKNLVTSPAFWFASVLLAFLMSFFASYAKDWTDKWYVRRSRKKDEEAKLRQKNFEEKVGKLREQPHLLALYQSNIVYQKLRQVLYFIVSYVAMVLSFYSTLRFEFGVALGMLIFSFAIYVLPIRSVSRHLYELRSIINAALEDNETHFVG
ncbi:MAG TPA: hypothetical protein VF527_20465 [Pyrinomonadaceae bacterium]|jgi:hypothetical protein